MDECAICYKSSISSDHSYTYYTAIKQNITFKTAVKTYDVNTYKFGYEKNTVYLCDECVKKSKSIRWQILLGSVLVFVVLVLSSRASEDPSWGLILTPFLGYLTYKLYDRFGVQFKLKKKLIEKRDIMRHWEQHPQIDRNRMSAQAKHKVPVYGEKLEIIAVPEWEYENMKSNS